MQNKLKLLFLIPTITKAGGVEKVVAQLSSYLQQTGKYEVTILNCLEITEEPFFKINPSVAIKSLNRPYYPTGAFAKILWYYQLIKPLDLYLSAHQFDVVFAEGGYLAATLSLCKIQNTIKVGCEHVSFDSANPIYSFLRRALLKRLNALIVLTEADQRYYSKFLEKVYHIPNFVAKIPTESTDHQSHIIVACGRLEKQKGFDLLIEAFKIVHARYPTWKLFIYGEGSKRQSLESQCEKEGLVDVVKLPGEVNQINSHLKKAAIFVLSSRYEGFPLVLLEAMSLGLCCICFDIKNVSEIINDKYNGSLVNAASVTDLAQSLCELIAAETERKQLGDRAKQTAFIYQLDAIGLKWQEVIAQFKKGVNAAV